MKNMVMQQARLIYLKEWGEPNWYQPVDRGLESKIAEKMTFLRKLDAKKSKV